MAKTISDAHLSLAYRLGQTAAPTSTTELAKRLNWFKKAIDFAIGEDIFWFMWDSTTDSTVKDQENYDFPTDYILIEQIKVDDYKYYKIPPDEKYERYEIPLSPVPILASYQKRAYYTRGDEYFLIPTPDADGTDNIDIWGYKLPTMPTASTSSIVLPDRYEDLLVSYAEMRYWSAAHKRGKAADAEAEYTTWVSKLRKENMRRRYGEQ